MGKTEIFLVRHGESQHHVDRSLDNFTSPLTQKGIQQAKCTGKYLKQFSTDPSVDCMISSELVRSRETAHIIAKTIGYMGKIEVNTLINELNYEQTPPQLKVGEDEFNPIYEAYRKKYKNNPIGYYKNLPSLEAELDRIFKKVGVMSIAQVKERLQKFIDQLSKTHCKKMIIVAHAGVNGIMTNMLLGYSYMSLAAPEGNSDRPEGDCSVSYWTLDDGKFQLISPVCTSHLSHF